MSQHDEPAAGPARLAYHDTAFIDGTGGRPVRILAEYLGPLEALEREQIRDTVVFFGSARTSADGPGAHYYEAARVLARRLSEWSLAQQCDWHRFVVCTGGGPGIMEAANRGAAEAGARSIGFNISLPFEQDANRYISPGLSFDFHYFFMRKLWLVHTACAAVVFPGGFGTFDELFELLTLEQTGKLRSSVPVLLYGREFWSEVVNLDALVRHGMIAPEDRDRLVFVDTPDEALSALQALFVRDEDGHCLRFTGSRTK